MANTSEDSRSPSTGEYPELHDGIARFLAKDLFFIGSNPKSGSTWLQVMLDAHPEISCGGEAHFIDHFAPLLREALTKHSRLINLKNRTIFNELRPFPGFADEHYRYLLTSAIALLMMRSANVREARVIGEKTPNNLIHFTHLGALFPRAKFVHLIRDGRDCAVSAWFHNHRTNPAELHRRHPSFRHFVEHIANNWKLIVSEGERFRATRPDRCLTVRYEDLTMRQHETMREVFGFLGVDTADSILERCLSDGAFEKMSGGRPAGVENRGSFMRQGRAGNWRQHLTPEVNRAFLEIAGDTMAKLGYHD